MPIPSFRRLRGAPLPLVLGLTVFAAMPSGPAGAQDPVKPAPCTGFTVTDRAGDQIQYPNPGLGLGATATKGPDVVDARGVFFNYKIVGGKPTLTANLQITNLTTEVPAEARSGGLIYFIDFSPSVGDVSYVQATNQDGEFTFSYGKVNRAPTGNGLIATATDTTGKIYPGQDGVIEINVPLDVSGAKPGTKIEGIYADTSYDYYASSDSAPDDGTKTYTVTECPAGAGTPAAGPAPEPEPTPGPQPSPTPGPGGPAGPSPAPGTPPASGGGTPSSSPSQGSLPVSGPLTVSAAVDRGKRSSARKRGLRARVRCSVQCNVQAVAVIDQRTARRLRLGKKTLRVATGRTTITQAGRIPFFLKLTSKAKKALARKGPRVSLKVQITVTDRNGGQVKRVTKKVTLR